jgi:hypothetical protein
MTRSVAIELYAFCEELHKRPVRSMRRLLDGATGTSKRGPLAAAGGGGAEPRAAERGPAARATLAR